MRNICITIGNHFHINGFALSLALKVRFFGTRKWPILGPLSLSNPFLVPSLLRSRSSHAEPWQCSERGALCESGPSASEGDYIPPISIINVDIHYAACTLAQALCCPAIHISLPLVSFTITLATISRKSWLTAAIKVSRGINASSILVAIMATDTAFVNIRYKTCRENNI